MPNSTSGKPWKLDTAAVITTENVYITEMLWTPTADGDDIMVQSNDGSEIWSYKAIAGHATERIEYPKRIDDYVSGFNLVTIDSGTLRVYVR